MKSLNKYIIAIDGPAGAGKSTISKLVANELGLLYIDTGAMYRAITCLKPPGPLKGEQEEEFISIAKQSTIEFKEQKVYLNNQDVTEKIRTPEISSKVSIVSAIPEIREILVDLQRKMGEKGGVILDGRDIGTTVFPNADVKIFLTASPEIRAKRRFDEQQEKNISNQSYEEVLQEIIKRDDQDMNRAVSPLKKADDAIEVNTDGLNIEGVTEKIIKIIS